MITIDLFLLITAAVCFALAAVGVGSRIGLVPAGLFCWVMTLLV